MRCILMRHGQAASYHPEGDKARPLTSAGEEQAIATARQLEALGWNAPRLLYSAAARTTRTAELILETWSTDAESAAFDSLYLGDLRQLTSALTRSPNDEVDCILVVGHNPGWSRIASVWSGVQVGLDVADAALLSIDAESWSEACASDGCWELEHFISCAGLPRG